MVDRYTKSAVGVLVASLIGLVIGVILRAKYAAEVQSCSTLLHQIEQRVSSTYKATCTTASAMVGVGTAIMVVCGAVAVLAAVVGIVRYMQTIQSKSV
jgi:type III secretory pathway component EscS